MSRTHSPRHRARAGPGEGRHPSSRRDRTGTRGNQAVQGRGAPSALPLPPDGSALAQSGALGVGLPADESPSDWKDSQTGFNSDSGRRLHSPRPPCATQLGGRVRGAELGSEPRSSGPGDSEPPSPNTAVPVGAGGDLVPHKVKDCARGSAVGPRGWGSSLQWGPGERGDGVSARSGTPGQGAWAQWDPGGGGPARSGTPGVGGSGTVGLQAESLAHARPSEEGQQPSPDS